MNSPLSLSACALILAGLPVLRAQTLVEHSLGTAAGAAASTGARRAGKAAAGIFGSLDKALQTAGKSEAKSTSSISRLPVQQSKEDKSKPGRVYETPESSKIAAGMDCLELVRRFGEPAVKTSEAQSDGLVEFYWYTPAGRDAVTVTVRNGKVAAVRTEPQAKQQTAGVVVLQ